METEEKAPSWPEGAGVLVVPGFPGSVIAGLGEAEAPYPDTTTDVVKLLREEGLSVEYAEPREGRALVSQWSADEYVLPVLAFTAQVLASGGGDLLADIVRRRIGAMRLPWTRLRVKVGRVDEKKGTVRWFEGDGPPEEVLEAMKRALNG